MKSDSRAGLYAYEFSLAANPMICRGLMLSGKIELSQDDELRRWIPNLSLSLSSLQSGEDETARFGEIRFRPSSQLSYLGLER